MPDFVGLIGYPVKHSISPYFQQAALDYHQLDIRYQLWETAPEKLDSRVAGLREHENLGANVTTPYKEKVLPLLDQIDEWAALIGAVNTIARRSDKLLGFNTDAHGFINALRKNGKFEPEGKDVTILGAGGAARAVCFSLVQNKVSSLTIVNRTPQRARVLIDHLNGYIAQTGLKSRISFLPWQGVNSADTFEQCQLIINCTTMGMKYTPQQEQSPLPVDVIPESILVYDLVFNPRLTPLLLLARKAKTNILGGLPMLVYQGAASFELWTGKKAPVDIMFNRAEEALNEMP